MVGIIIGTVTQWQPLFWTAVPQSVKGFVPESMLHKLRLHSNSRLSVSVKLFYLQKNKSAFQRGLGHFSIAVYCKRAGSESSLVTCILSPSLHRLLMLWGITEMESEVSIDSGCANSFTNRCDRLVNLKEEHTSVKDSTELWRNSETVRGWILILPISDAHPESSREVIRKQQITLRPAGDRPHCCKALISVLLLQEVSGLR